MFLINNINKFIKKFQFYQKNLNINNFNLFFIKDF